MNLDDVTDRSVANDTYGEITRAELADLRRSARPCSHCGMLATVDPVFHQNRYGHAPSVRPDRTGARTSFNWSGGQWVQL